MKQKDNSTKDWRKAAKAFARQAYGRKMKSIRQGRRIMERAAKDEYWDN